MKLRTHHHNRREASLSFFSKVILVISVVLMAFAVPMQLTKNVSADPYDDQINAIQREINAYQTEANRLAGEVQTLQAALDRLSNEKAALQAQVDLSQAKYDKLVIDIVSTEQKIKSNQDVLGDTIADLYVDGKITPIEMLASSKSVSEYLDKQEYRNSVRDQLTATIVEIKALKIELDTQKAEVEKVLAQQKAQRDQLAAKEAEQQSLVNQTQGQEQAYQTLVANNKQKLTDVAAQQQAYYQSLGGGASAGVYGSFVYQNLSPGNGAGGCSGGYPYCMPQDTYVDPWALYNRECVSYVAWALEQRFGKYVGSFSGRGNAYEWPSSAPLYSGAYRTYDPQPGDAVVLPQSGGFAPIGHVMIVESVSNGWITVSQFNFYGTGQYSTMDIRNSGVIFLRFQDR